MIDHVSVPVRDLAASAAFYERVLAPLGYTRLVERPATIGFGKKYPEFWLNLRAEMPPIPADTGMHVCLRAPSEDAVRAFHALALEHGGEQRRRAGPAPGRDDHLLRRLHQGLRTATRSRPSPSRSPDAAAIASRLTGTSELRCRRVVADDDAVANQDLAVYRLIRHGAQRPSALRMITSQVHWSMRRTRIEIRSAPTRSIDCTTYLMGTEKPQLLPQSSVQLTSPSETTTLRRQFSELAGRSQTELPNVRRNQMPGRLAQRIGNVRRRSKYGNPKIITARHLVRAAHEPATDVSQ